MLATIGDTDGVTEAAAVLSDANAWKGAIVAVAEGRYAEAARLYLALGCPPLAADADLLAAHQAHAEGREADVQRHARAVRAFA
jgi:hypothetical protein